MSLSKKKAIHILSVTEDRITLLKEIPLPEPPLHMVMIKFFFLIYSDMNHLHKINYFLSIDEHSK